MTPHKPIIAIIGAIGAGKSTVAEVFAQYGGRIINGDRHGHAVLESPEMLSFLRERWGNNVLHEDGTPNRRAIAEIVFNDADELKALEAAMFPRIRERVEAEIAQAEADSTVKLVVLDVPVMLEAGWSVEHDLMIFVDAPRDQRLARLHQRNGWSPDQVAAREARQMPLEQKRQHADQTIENDGSLEELADTIEKIIKGSSTWSTQNPKR